MNRKYENGNYVDQEEMSDIILGVRMKIGKHLKIKIKN